MTGIPEPTDRALLDSICITGMDKSKVQFRNQRLFSILLLCCSTAISLLLGELVLRFALPKSYSIWKPHLEKVFKPKQDVMPGISGDSRFLINSRGIRGDEFTPTHTYRILAIGGSTTECLFLDQTETWSHLLQKTLNENASKHNVWVGNAGLSGKSTRNHIAAMQLLPLEEMKIDAIILLIGINDFSERLARNEDYDPNFLSKPDGMRKIVDETFTGGSHPYPGDSFLKRTALFQLLRKVKGMAPQKSGQNVIQDAAGQVYVTWRKHRRQATEIRDELPDLSSGLDEYTRNINKMIEIAREKSIRLIFMTQPTMWKRGLPKELEALLWFGGIGNFQEESGKVYYSWEALENGMKKYNAALLKICQEKHVECIDLAPLLEKDTTVFYDDVHFNESGARKVSKALSNHILGRSPFGGSSVAK